MYQHNKSLARRHGMRAILVVTIAIVCTSCIKERRSNCPVPHHVTYDWSNLVETDGTCRGQVHLRMYHSNGMCFPFDVAGNSQDFTLLPGHYEALTFNNAMEGLVYSDLDNIHTAKATVQDTASPELVARIDALLDGITPSKTLSKAGEPLIGQAESFLYWDTLPQVNIDFNYEKRDTLIPQPIGYEFEFVCSFSNVAMADIDSMEMTLSGVSSEVYLLEGNVTEAAARTAICHTTRSQNTYDGKVYVLGLQPSQPYIFRGYIELAGGQPPIYVEKDVTDIINEAIKGLSPGSRPLIKFSMNLTALSPGILTIGDVVVTIWEEVEGGEMEGDLLS